MAHDAKHFRRVYTRTLIVNYPTTLSHPKMPLYVSCEYKVEGSGCGLNQNKENHITIKIMKILKLRKPPRDDSVIFP